MQSTDIEPITGDNWLEASSALCRAAMTYETLLVKCLEQRPELVQEVLAEYMEDVDAMSAVIQHWRHFLEISD